jgi:hypothetical protein
LVIIRLSAACRNTSVSRTTGTTPDEMMSIGSRDSAQIIACDLYRLDPRRIANAPVMLQVLLGQVRFQGPETCVSVRGFLSQ